MTRAAAVFAALFGALTVFSGARVLFGGHIAAGAPYEARTVAAMAVRTGFWVAVAAALLATGRRTLT